MPYSSSRLRVGLLMAPIIGGSDSLLSHGGSLHQDVVFMARQAV